MKNIFNKIIHNNNFNKVIKEFSLKIFEENNKKYIEYDQFISKILFLNVEKNQNYFYHSYKENKDYILISECEKLLGKTFKHPENYNAQQLMNLNTIKKYKKKDEIKILALIYKHFRNKYKLKYQYNFNSMEYIPDLVIELKNGGLIIEVNEKFHQNYNEVEELRRRKILESSGYHIIKLIPDLLEEQTIIQTINEAIKDYELIYSVNIDIEYLWEELNNNSIERDFFNFIGKSITSNVKYCVFMDDVAKYLGYRFSSDAIRRIGKYLDPMTYISLSREEIKNRDDIQSFNTVTSIKKNFIFLTRFGFYNFCLLSQTKKAKIYRPWIIQIYEKYHDLLIYTRNNLINKNKDNNPFLTKELYLQKKIAEKDKFENRQNKIINELKQQMKNLETIIKKQNTKICRLNNPINNKYDEDLAQYFQNTVEIYQNMQIDETNYQKLKENNFNFEIPKDMIDNNDEVKTFLKNECKKTNTEKDYKTLKDLFRKFLDYAKKNNIKTTTKEKDFKERVCKEFPYKERFQPRINSKCLNLRSVFTNIKLNDDEEEIEIEDDIDCK